MSIRVVNNFSTTVATALVPAATTLVMAAGAGNTLRTKLTGSSGTAMAAGDYVYLTLADSGGNIEIVKMTALPSAGDSCTIVRGQDGTTSRATDWAAGAVVDARPCAAFFTDALLLLGTTATAVSYSNATSGLVAANVQAAIDALDAAIDALPVFGTAATKNTGTVAGAVPLVGTKSATDALAGLVELATQAEAEAGTANDVVATPLRVAQAIAALAPVPTFPAAYTGTTKNTSLGETSGQAASGTATKLCEFRMPIAGTVVARVGVIGGTAENAGVTYNSVGYAQLYKNGVAVGTLRSNSSVTTWAYYDENVTFSAGDLLQVYGYQTSGANIPRTGAYLALWTALTADVAAVFKTIL